MLQRTVIVLVSLVFALLCTAAGHIAYASITVTWLDRIHFFNYLPAGAFALRCCGPSSRHLNRLSRARYRHASILGRRDRFFGRHLT